MYELIALSMIPAFWYLNRWRGDIMENIIGRSLGPIKNGAPIAALGLGLYTLILGINPTAALLVIAAYMLGESIGWSKWYAASTLYYLPDGQQRYNNQYANKNTGKINGIQWIASRFFDEKTEFIEYSVLALFIRGIYWWLPVYLVLGYFNIIYPGLAVMGVIAMGAGFPVAYTLGSPSHPNNINIPDKHRVMLNEKYYGAWQGLILALTFIGSM